MAASLRHAFWALMIILLGVYLAHEAGHLQAERAMVDQRSAALQTLTAHRAQLEGGLNASLYLTSGLASLIGVDGGMDADRFILLADNLIGSNPHVLNIGLAPGNTTRIVHPLAANEQALGLHYPETADQWATVQRAIEQRRAVVVGPVRLAHGGFVVINRIPVFMLRGPQEGTYWGMVSSVIDFDALLEFAGLKDGSNDYRFALRGKDGKGGEGAVFWGDPSLFFEPHASLEIRLPEGNWVLGVIPREGWVTTRSWETDAFRIGATLALIIAVLAFLLLRKQESVSHLAMHDSLTELLNRRAFDGRLEEAMARQKRHGGSFALLHLDLDGFKPINDQLGHAAGDQALRILSTRLRAVLRRDDIVARLGGDEFGILLQSPDPSAVEMAEKVAEKVLLAISLPIRLDGELARVSASIGIAACPDHGCDEDALMRLADQAMYEAKESGKACWRVVGSAKVEEERAQHPQGQPLPG